MTGGGVQRRRQQDGAGAEELAAVAAHVRAEQDHDAGKARHQTEYGDAARPLGRRDPDREQGHEQRRGRDQDPGQR